MPSTTIKPNGVGVPVAGRLLGLSHQSAYRRVLDGTLPVLPLGGRKLVSVAKLEAMIGRPITAEEIAAAIQPTDDQK